MVSLVQYGGYSKSQKNMKNSNSGYRKTEMCSKNESIPVNVYPYTKKTVSAIFSLRTDKRFDSCFRVSKIRNCKVSSRKKFMKYL